MQLKNKFHTFTLLGIISLLFLIPNNNSILPNTEPVKINKEQTGKGNHKIKLDLLSLISINRYKPLAVITLNNDNRLQEQASQTDQQQIFGINISICNICETTKNIRPEPQNIPAQATWITEMNFALLFQLGSRRSIRSVNNKAHKPETILFIPGNNLYSGVTAKVFDLQETKLTIGRKGHKSKLQEILLGANGSLTGLFIDANDKDYGSFKISFHRPLLAGNYFNQNRELQQLDWQESFLKQASVDRSIASRLSWSSQCHFFCFSLYLDQQQINAKTQSNNNSWKIDSLRYTGLSLGIKNNSSNGRHYNFYFNLEQLDGKTQQLLVNDIGKYSSPIRAYAFRTGFLLQFSNWGLSSDFFLPTSKTIKKGSQTSTDELSGYIGFGNNPVQTNLLSGPLDLQPWYVNCSNQELCSGFEQTSDELGLRKPSAVLNIKLNYKRDNWQLELLGSILQPLKAMDSHAGSSALSHQKKDTKDWSWREVQLEGRYTINKSGSILASYSRVYRISPKEPDTNQLISQNKKTSLIAERFEIQFRNNIY